MGRSFGDRGRGTGKGQGEPKSGFFGPAAGKHTKRKASPWAGPVGRQPSFWDWLTGDAQKEAKRGKDAKWGGQHAKGKDDWLKRNMGI